MLTLSFAQSCASESRGVRNNNPGNIVETSIDWEGEVEYNTDGKFEQFVSPYYGVRAMYLNLAAYQEKHGITTTAGLIARWAPPSENPKTYTYFIVGHVGESGVVGNNTYTLNLVKWMIYFENGYHPYSNDLILKVLGGSSE